MPHGNQGLTAIGSEVWVAASGQGLVWLDCPAGATGGSTQAFLSAFQMLGREEERWGGLEAVNHHTSESQTLLQF